MSGVARKSINKYPQMNKNELFALTNFIITNPNWQGVNISPKVMKNSLGIPTMLDRIIRQCMNLILELICEAKFYPYIYGFRPYRVQKHIIRDIINIVNRTF